MLKSRNISQQLILVFGLVLGIAGVIGAVGVLGARAITTTIQSAASEALPRAEQAAELAETGAKMEVMIVSYLDHFRVDETIVANITDLQTRLVKIVSMTEKDGLANTLKELGSEIDIAMDAHRDASQFVFSFEDTQYTLPGFLEHIAVENAAYLKTVDEATRFGVFDGVATDPTLSSFARWVSSFETSDEDLAALLAAYGAAEADMVTYVSEKIVVNPERAEAQFIRMQSRRTPKVARALDALTVAAKARFKEVEKGKAEALNALQVRLDAFIEISREEQHDAMREMAQSVLRAEGRGNLTMISVAVVFAIGFGIAVLASLFATRRIGNPLQELSNVITALADRKFDTTIPFRSRTDEIGAIANAAETFRESGLAREALEREQLKERERAETERLERMEREHAAQRETERREIEAKEAEDARLADANRVAEEERAERQAEQAQVVESLANGLRRLAAGDLSVTIKDPFTESYDQLRIDFNEAVMTLTNTMRSISLSAETINSNVAELTSTAEDLSRRTERSAAALEETSAAVEELTASVKSTSAGADDADTIVSKAKDSAEQGNAIVSETVLAMGAIEESSNKISKIISVIDEISFQTNLLALNAGVEAARAGEAGRGFAVVASEVRALAQRSSEAAREIDELISDSGVQVTNGVGLVDKVGEALKGIVGSVSDISVHVSSIATSSREQANGISEINSAVSELDSSTQQNAAMFEETTAATHSLAQEASNLATSIARFTIAESSSCADLPILAAE